MKSYEKAFTELQEIVNKLEKSDIGIDELSAKLKEASELICVCKQKLTATEHEVDKILKEINAPDN